MTQPLYAGIDVSKDWCDVALEAGDASARFDQTLEGRKDLARWLKAQGITHAVLEASGGYERSVLRALDDAGLQACLAPRTGSGPSPKPRADRLRPTRSTPVCLLPSAGCSAPASGPAGTTMPRLSPPWCGAAGSSST